LALLAVFFMLPVGCAGIAKGVTQALIGDKDKPKEDTRQCYIRGRSLQGIDSFLTGNAQRAAGEGSSLPDLKVLMVHGIGSHQPGYSARLAENLARSLSLNKVQENPKEFVLTALMFPGRELGVLRVQRYLNADGTRVMLFYELTWDPIVEKEKQNLAFDSSEESAYRRAVINRALKGFVNDTVPDVLMYNGTSKDLIQASVGQALCWMMSAGWTDLPNGGQQGCNAYDKNFLVKLDDDYVFVTHSLGSRITIDALRRIAEVAKEDVKLSKNLAELQHKKFTVFMLSNQLPLLQLGQLAPSVRGQIRDICSPNSTRSSERMFAELRIVAFSDPNDLMSYSIPPWFLDEYIDSRLCPTLTNVILNITPVIDLFGLGDVANPMSAHVSYDNDSRVIGIITKGIGVPGIDPDVAKNCTWLEVIPEGK
jgi:hypothetical protein